uniref:Uncharacterized protein n=1 Tax=Oryza sativa subsp. japonica TaxID=39947 RepID=Q653H2_ORYSJ|nr:hypothetical protein [Oryza sativa Japonica Group]BAD46045.1 hypothetical protein [Oryza sativa Japonica Group]
MDADLILSCLPIPNPGHPVTVMVTIWVMCFAAADLEVQEALAAVPSDSLPDNCWLVFILSIIAGLYVFGGQKLAYSASI